MKLCLVSQEYPPETGGGGIGTKHYIEAQGMAQRGHEVHVIAASIDSEPRETMDGNVHVHRLGLPDMPVPGYEPTTFWLIYSQVVAKAITDLHREHHFDLIQFAEYAGEGFIFQTDTFAHRDCPYLLQLHGPISMFARHMGWPDEGSTMHRIGAFLEKTVIEYVDQVLACSYNTARFASETYGVDLNQINVVHSAVDTDRFDCPLAEDIAEGPRMLFIGKVATNKGFDHIVRAMIKTRDQLPNACLRVIGRGGKGHIDSIMKEAEAAGIRNRIELMGYVPHDELPEQFRWSTLFVCPSVYEGGPGHVFLEAMACRRPIIACASGGTPEVVRDGLTGLLVEPGDVDGLAAAMLELANDPVRSAAIAEQGRTDAVNKFSLSAYHDKIEAIYKDVIERFTSR